MVQGTIYGKCSLFVGHICTFFGMVGNEKENRSVQPFRSLVDYRWGHNRGFPASEQCSPSQKQRPAKFLLKFAF